MSRIIEADFIPYQAETRIGRGTALVFAPHPDDEVFGCGGAILCHVADGDAVRVIIVTDGAFGAGEERESVFEARQAESRAAAKILGYGEPVFWALPDRSLMANEALIQRIQEELRQRTPAWVYAPSWWEIHPDHVALSQAVTEAVRRSSFETHLVLFEIGMVLPPNRLLDISRGLEAKRAAMACFGSQLERQPYDQHVLALNRYRTFTLPPDVKAAEAYRIIERETLPRNVKASLSMKINNVVSMESYGCNTCSISQWLVGIGRSGIDILIRVIRKFASV